MNNSTTPTTNVRTTIPKFGRVAKDLLRDPAISSHAKVAYALLDDAAGWEEISMSRLAGWMGVSRDTARAAIYALRDAGWVQVEERWDGARQMENAYVVHGTPIQGPPADISAPQGNLSTTPQGTCSPPPREPVPHNSYSETSTRRTRPQTGAGARDASGVVLFADGQPPAPADEFEEFWSVYPTVRGTKADARKAWTTAVRHADGGAAVIVAGARRYAEDPYRVDAYTPGAGPWLRREGWTAPPEMPRGNVRMTAGQRAHAAAAAMGLGGAR